MRNWSEWAPIPLRLILGFGFVYHGFPKLFNAQEREGTVGMFQGLGIPMPEMSVWLVGIVEFVGGLALILGAFVAIFAALNLVSMLVALFVVHLPNGFNFMNITGMTPEGQPEFGMPGYEVNLLYIAGLLALILGGAGAMSVDQARADRTASGAGTTGGEPSHTAP